MTSFWYLNVVTDHPNTPGQKTFQWLEYSLLSRSREPAVHSVVQGNDKRKRDHCYLYIWIFGTCNPDTSRQKIIGWNIHSLVDPESLVSRVHSVHQGNDKGKRDHCWLHSHFLLAQVSLHLRLKSMPPQRNSEVRKTQIWTLKKSLSDLQNSLTSAMFQQRLCIKFRQLKSTDHPIV